MCVSCQVTSSDNYHCYHTKLHCIGMDYRFMEKLHNFTYIAIRPTNCYYKQKLMSVCTLLVASPSHNLSCQLSFTPLTTFVIRERERE